MQRIKTILMWEVLLNVLLCTIHTIKIFHAVQELAAFSLKSLTDQNYARPILVTVSYTSGWTILK